MINVLLACSPDRIIPELSCALPFEGNGNPAW